MYRRGDGSTLMMRGITEVEIVVLVHRSDRFNMHHLLTLLSSFLLISISPQRIIHVDSFWHQITSTRSTKVTPAACVRIICDRVEINPSLRKCRV